MSLILFLLHLLTHTEVFLLLCLFAICSLFVLMRVSHNRKHGQNLVAFLHDLKHLWTSKYRDQSQKLSRTNAQAKVISLEAHRRSRSSSASSGTHRSDRGGEQLLSPEHQAQVRAAVKRIVRLVAERSSERVTDMTIYARIWEHFDVASYCDIPDHRFDELMHFLQQELWSLLA